MKSMKTTKRIGQIYNSIVPYYDRNTHQTKLKARPCLILYVPEGKDKEYTILPISSSLDSRFKDERFDTLIELSSCPKLKLRSNSIVRAHKQTIVYETNIDFTNCLGDLKRDYHVLYKNIINKVKQYDLLKIKCCR